MLVFLCLTVPLLVTGKVFNVEYEWKYFDYDYPSDAERTAAIANKSFVLGAPLAIDVDIQYGRNGKRVFVTSPSFSQGVPAGVATVTNKQRDGQYLLAPYPHWSWHTDQKSCKKDRIVAVFRTQIDECGRIWILDSGRFEDTMTCPPQLLAFDLATDTLVHRFELPADYFKYNSYFVTPIVDVRDSCQNVFVYMADCGAYSLVVRDVANNSSWIIRDKTFYPDPEFGDYTIVGQSFELMDGILGMSIEPYTGRQDRKLFYHALSSNTEHWVNTSDIRVNSQRFGLTLSAPEIFHTYSGRRKSQSAPTAISRNGIQFFGEAAYTSIYCWNTKTQYGRGNFQLVEFNEEKLQFTSGMKIIKNRSNREELWIVTNRLQKAFTGTANLQEINFRILKANVDQVGSCKC